MSSRRKEEVLPAKGAFTNYVDKFLALCLTTYPPRLTFSTLWTLTKNQQFWTTYPPLLVNVVCNDPNQCTTRTNKAKDWISTIKVGLTLKGIDQVDRSGILFPNLFRTTVRKNCSNDLEKLLKMNLPNLWVHCNNLFEQWKVRTIFETECFFNLFLEVFSNLIT
jgi:hypothetical protein